MRTLAFLLLSTVALAQSQVKLDSLQLQLSDADSDTLRMKLMIELYKFYVSFDYVKAAEYATKTKELAAERNDEKYMIIAERALSAVFFYMGDYKMASQHFYNALKYYESTGDTLGMAAIYLNLGAVQDRLLVYDKALEYYLKAQSILNSVKGNEAKKILYLTSLYNNTGDVYRMKKDFKSARQYYEKTLDLARQSGNKPLEGIVLNNLGQLFLNNLGEPEKAFDFFTEGLQVRKEVGNKSEIAKSYIQLSNYYLKLKNYSEAERSAKKAVELGNEIGSLEEQRDGFLGLSAIQEAMGNHSESLKSFKQFNQLSDSIQKQVAGGEITKLQLQYDFEKAEAAREEEKARIRLRYITIIIVLSVFLTLAILITVIIRAKARQTELKRKNLAQDVEIKNKELTTNVMYLIRKNELINSVAERLLKFEQSATQENQRVIHDIIMDLQREADNDTWKEFELRFNQVHSEFYTNLRKSYPGLSPADEKLCAFLRLNMSSKEIAAITQQSIKSVEVARARLRKKLNLTNTTSNLVTHLSNL